MVVARLECRPPGLHRHVVFGDERAADFGRAGDAAVDNGDERMLRCRRHLRRSGDGSDHIILSSDNYARESVNQFSGNRRRRRPHWLNFVRVADVSAAADKAVTLGGQVVVQPHADREGNRMAVIVDPAGAALGLMQWVGGASGAAR